MNHLFMGLLLIGIGLFSLLGNFGLVSGEFFLIIVGAVFLAAYMTSKRTPRPLGFLIPGCITLAVGIFSNLEYYIGRYDGPIFFWVLGAAFITIHLIHSQFSGLVNRSTQWALMVGAGLIAFGGFVFATMFLEYEPIRFTLHNFWPVALILGGIALIFSKKKPQINPSSVVVEAKETEQI
jgi:hypothetical protein